MERVAEALPEAVAHLAKREQVAAFWIARQVPSRASPPAATRHWTCGWATRVRPQVWSAAIQAGTAAPRRRSSDKSVRSVSAETRNSRSPTARGFHCQKRRNCQGRVKITW